jgi:hypothetical protein
VLIELQERKDLEGVVTESRREGKKGREEKKGGLSPNV